MARKGLISAMLAGIMAAVTLLTPLQTKEVKAKETKSSSIEYVKKMGYGWNLGNEFDGFIDDQTQPDQGETSWGNPKVTKELIDSVKKNGFNTIRMPLTLYRRYTVNENAKDGEIKYVLDQSFLKRYKEVVDWAVDKGMYVIINIHHDSWIWLKYWDGSTDSEEYRMYTDLWKQLSDYFKDEPEQVSFETINEPQFDNTDDDAGIEKTNALNKAAWEIIRSEEKNKDRMILMPTLNTNADASKTSKLRDLILSLNDDHVIATVHYYSEWLYSANLGITGFEEAINDQGYTPRQGAVNLFDQIKKDFTDNGIGTVIGEYGLLGYDSGDVLQTGEELKYYEFMSRNSSADNVGLVLWDNGSMIDRNTYKWKNSRIGKEIKAAMKGSSSYSTGLDTIYLNKKVKENISIPIELNGNKFKKIKGTSKKYYSFNAKKSTLYIKSSYVNKKYKAHKGYGRFLTLKIQFSSGSEWNEYLVKTGNSEVKDKDITYSGTGDLTVKMNYKGDDVKRVSAVENDKTVGPNSSWWKYLQRGSAYNVDASKNTLILCDDFFNDASVEKGKITINVEFYSGKKLSFNVNY